MPTGNVRITTRPTIQDGQTYTLDLDNNGSNVLSLDYTFHTPTMIDSKQFNIIDPTFSGMTSPSGVTTGFSAAASYINYGSNIVWGHTLMNNPPMSYQGNPGIFHFFRLDYNGTLLNATNIGAGRYLQSITLQNDKLIVVSNIPGSNNTRQIRRYSSTGSFDSTFNEPVFNVGYGAFPNLYARGDNKIMLTSNYLSFTTINGSTTQKYIARLNADGTFDSTWNSGGVGLSVGGGSQPSFDLNIMNDDSMLFMIGGYALPITYNGTTIKGLTKLNSSGTLNTTFNTNVMATPITYGTTPITATEVSTGKIYVFSRDYKLYRLNSNGTLDNTWTVKEFRRDAPELTPTTYYATQLIRPNYGPNAGGVLMVGGYNYWRNVGDTNWTHMGFALNINEDGTILTIPNAGFENNNILNRITQLYNGNYITGSSEDLMTWDGVPAEDATNARVLGDGPSTYAAFNTNMNHYLRLKEFHPLSGGTYSVSDYNFGNQPYYIDINYPYDGSDFLSISNVTDSDPNIDIIYEGFASVVTFLDVILTESPAWLTYTNEPEDFDYVTLDLWVYRGGISDYPVDPTFSFTKFKVTTGDTTVAFNVSDFVGGLINPKLSDNWIYDEDITNHDFGETVWVKYRVRGWSGDSDTPVDTEEGTKLATKGWGFFEQGPNPQLTSNLVADPRNNYITQGHKAWEARLNLPVESGSTTTGNIVTRLDMIEEMNAVCEPKYPTYQVVYLNKNGFYEGFSFPKASREKVTIEKKDYFKLSRTPYNYSPLNHYKNVVEKDTTKEITLNTDMGLSDYDVTKLGYMVESRQHYLIDIDNNRILPVVLKTTDFEVKNRLNQKAQVQYEFTFEYANQVKNNIR